MFMPVPAPQSGPQFNLNQGCLLTCIIKNASGPQNIMAHIPRGIRCNAQVWRYCDFTDSPPLPFKKNIMPRGRISTFTLAVPDLPSRHFVSCVHTYSPHLNHNFLQLPSGALEGTTVIAISYCALCTRGYCMHKLHLHERLVQRVDTTETPHNIM